MSKQGGAPTRTSLRGRWRTGPVGRGRAPLGCGRLRGVRRGPRLGLATANSSIYVVVMSTRAMQEATFLILTSLAAGSQHGYGIIADVTEISGGRVKLLAE